MNAILTQIKSKSKEVNYMLIGIVAVLFAVDLSYISVFKLFVFYLPLVLLVGIVGAKFERFIVRKVAERD